MKDKLQTSRTRADGAAAPRTRGEHADSDAADAPRTRPEQSDCDAPATARDASRGEPSGSAEPNKSRNSGRDAAARDSSRDDDERRDSARDVARDSVRHAARDSTRDGARDARIAAERRLLAALCQGSLAASARGDVLQRLNEHAFGDPEDEIIFRALVKIPNGDAEFVRTALGLRLTRAGFPDFDLEPFFSAPAPDAAEVAEILREFDSL